MAVDVAEERKVHAPQGFRPCLVAGNAIHAYTQDLGAQPLQVRQAVPEGDDLLSSRRRPVQPVKRQENISAPLKIGEADFSITDRLQDKIGGRVSYTRHFLSRT